MSRSSSSTAYNNAEHGSHGDDADKPPPPPPAAAAGGGSDKGHAQPVSPQENKAAVMDDEDCNKQPRSMLAEAIERGGLSGWASYLTFYWAGPFLSLGSSRTIKEEDLEGIFKTHRRYVLGNFECVVVYVASGPQGGVHLRRDYSTRADLVARVPETYSVPINR